MARDDFICASVAIFGFPRAHDNASTALEKVRDAGKRGRFRDSHDAPFLLADKRQNILAPILMSNASTVVLNKYAKMQWTLPMRRIGLLTNDTSAVCPDVPMTDAK